MLANNNFERVTKIAEKFKQESKTKMRKHHRLRAFKTCAGLVIVCLEPYCSIFVFDGRKTQSRTAQTQLNDSCLFTCCSTCFDDRSKIDYFSEQWNVTHAVRNPNKNSYECWTWENMFGKFVKKLEYFEWKRNAWSYATRSMRNENERKMKKVRCLLVDWSLFAVQNILNW